MADESYSVVIVSFNHATTLPACLASVASMAPAPERVILVDNASTDGSPDITARYSRALPVELLRRPVNTGFAVAANAGIAATGHALGAAAQPRLRASA